MRDRGRVLREIAVNAAVVFACLVEDCVVSVDAIGDEGFRCSVRAGGAVEEARGKTESAATWALLDRLIDRANGNARPSQSLVTTPQLQTAIRLLQLSRLELIEEIRRELDASPMPPDALTDDEGAPRKG